MSYGTKETKHCLLVCAAQHMVGDKLILRHPYQPHVITHLTRVDSLGSHETVTPAVR